MKADILTEKQMIEIIENKTISMQSDEHQKQIMNFAFGEIFMKSKNKGEKVTYSNWWAYKKRNFERCETCEVLE